MNLPPRLLLALTTRIKDNDWTDRPRIVALGADKNFLLITENKATVWDLSNYRSLTQMLEYAKRQDKGIEEIQNIILHSYRYQGFVAQSRNGTILYEGLPEWNMQGIEGIKGPVLRDTREAEVRQRQFDLQRRPSLRTMRSERSNGRVLEERARLKREWSDKKAELRTQAKGLKISLSLSVSAGGIALNKMLG